MQSMRFSDKQDAVETENLMEESNEEFSEEIIYRTSSDNENDCSEKSMDELDEEGAQGPSEYCDYEPSEESDYEPSEDTGKMTEQPGVVLSEEEEVEPTEDTYKESLLQPLSNNGFEESDLSTKETEGKPCEEPFDTSQLPFHTNNKEYQLESVPTDLRENKRSLDAKDGDYHLTKKCKLDQPFGSESDAGSVPTPNKRNEFSKACNNAAKASEQQEHSRSSGKLRRSRWEPLPKCDGQGCESNDTSKRRKTRWAPDDSQLMLYPIQLPDVLKRLVEADMDPELQELQKELAMINKRLKRANSPPVYDDFGIRIKTNHARFQERLVRDRQNVVERLIEKNPTFNPPPDYKPKLCKTLYLPLKEYPGYNFTGLIIGPRALTVNRMEKETGATISLRGKGSGSARDGRPHRKHPSDDEDLHVYIEADNQKSLNDAVGRVQKLLIPADEGINEHKRAQLKELAQLKVKLRDDFFCDTCGGLNHSTVKCPLTMSTPGSNIANQQKMSFLADLGGAGEFTFSTPQTSSPVPCQGGNPGFGISPSYNSNSLSGPGSTSTTDGKSSKKKNKKKKSSKKTKKNSSKKIDDANLFVRYLPQTVDDDRLKGLFAPYGRLLVAKVLKDPNTGGSKGCGFVKYDNPLNAATALAHMNGYKIDGKTLAVMVSGKPCMPVPSSTNLLPLYQAPALVSQDYPSQALWPGPPGSVLPDSQFSSTKSNNFVLPNSSIFSGHSDSSCEQVPASSGHFSISSPSSLVQFPGNLNYPRSQYPSYFIPPSSLSQQLYLTQSPSSSISPFSWTPIYPHGK